MTADLSRGDRGKTVLQETERIGVVTDVRSGQAHVEPDWDHVPDALAETLDRDADADAQTIEASTRTAVRNSEIRLRDDLPWDGPVSLRSGVDRARGRDTAESRRRVAR